MFWFIVPLAVVLTLTFMLWMHFGTSKGFRRIHSGDTYRVGKDTKTVSKDLAVRGNAFFIQRRYRDRIRDLMRAVVLALEAKGIQYFIYCGTLLGQARHGGLMPHDDDIDLFIECLPEPPDLSEFGLEVWNRGDIWNASFVGERYPYVDLVPVTLRHGLVTQALPYDSAGKPTFKWSEMENNRREITHPDLIFPLQRVPFEDFQVWAPGDIPGCIKHLFGDSAMTELVDDGNPFYNHRTSVVFKWRTNVK